MFDSILKVIFDIYIMCSGARVWGPFKELYHTVELAIHRRQPEAIQDLDIVLRKHKTDFISLLQNPVSYSWFSWGLETWKKIGI